jgi:arabinose-5-phosphate isomerase
MAKTTDFITSGKRTISMERDSLTALIQRVDDTFTQACNLMLACEGRIIVTGMGKSGHIAHKIAATLASTGTPAFFMHPAEANHGDLGMVTNKDCVLALSNSGTTVEILSILPLLKRKGVSVITLTGKPDSPLAKEATLNLDVSITQEACPLDLAPTSSTTVALAMGDALAIALLEARGFTAEDFAFSHPGGRLGRRLLLRVADIMNIDAAIPLVDENMCIRDALFEITKKGFGMTGIINQDGKLRGIFTDGDLRRALDRGININDTAIKTVMTSPCKTLKPQWLAVEAVNMMETNKIGSFIVVDDNDKPVGAIHTHDLLRAGVV